MHFILHAKSNAAVPEESDKAADKLHLKKIKMPLHKIYQY